MIHAAVLRTHGGLGNQIFQVLFGRLFSQKRNLRLIQIHDANYKHAFPKSEHLRCDTSATSLQFMISSLRIPKVSSRFFKRPEYAFSFLGDCYLDGYFQDKKYYQSFSEVFVSQQLKVLADELKIEAAKSEKLLVHLRLGDFFKDRLKARAHLIQRLSNIPNASDVITNDEFLLSDDYIQAAMCDRSINLIKTADMSSVELLRLMSKYKNIDSNGSTLTFWASVLAGSCVKFSDRGLKTCQEYFEKLRNF